MKYLLSTMILLSSLIMSACNGSLSNIEGGELRKRAYTCVIDTNLSAAEIQVCRNIQRECQRRQKVGIFDC